ncbi:FAS1-like dehydratase domain-containing protein [Roseomonas chloroacetimidivorans]|uniref:FAS1-like dehydratase domain-containing protein n=1 Tax=Roseomonas chloroacetimidivorans TaxID=1766656 RepID=UPI003C74859C
MAEQGVIGPDLSELEFRDWIGRSMSTEDDITLSAVRRIAVTFDQPADTYGPGDMLPPHWYSMFFPALARQSELGHDGHPRKGDFLPPVPLPRRMFVGRRVRFPGALRVGDHAVKRSEIAAVTPKRGRSGTMVFLTVRHTISVAGEPVVIEDQEVVYREAAAPGAGLPQKTPAPPPAGATWRETVFLDPVLLFRYSAITWNGHRIHYDADYARNQEGYPACVQNGGLTVHLLVDAAIRRSGKRPSGLTARLLQPLFVGHNMVLTGRDAADGHLSTWAEAESGGLAASVELELPA